MKRFVAIFLIVILILLVFWTTQAQDHEQGDMLSFYANEAYSPESGRSATHTYIDIVYGLKPTGLIHFYGAGSNVDELRLNFIDRRNKDVDEFFELEKDSGFVSLRKDLNVIVLLYHNKTLIFYCTKLKESGSEVIKRRNLE